jgi:hypothetical protein
MGEWKVMLEERTESAGVGWVPYLMALSLRFMAAYSGSSSLVAACCTDPLIDMNHDR